jgi:hypothetical protein
MSWFFKCPIPFRLSNSNFAPSDDKTIDELRHPPGRDSNQGNLDYTADVNSYSLPKHINP